MDNLWFWAGIIITIGLVYYIFLLRDELNQTQLSLYDEKEKHKRTSKQLVSSQKQNADLKKQISVEAEVKQKLVNSLEIQRKSNTQDIQKLDLTIKQYQAKNNELELQLNQALGHFQAEKQRNLLAEHAHISESIAKLTTLEQQLAARDTTT